MISFISFLIALLATIPLVSLIVFLIIFGKILANKRKAFGLSVDITTFFAIFSAAAISSYIWHQTFLGIILLVILMTAIIYTFIFWKTKEDFEIKRLFKGIWRLNFLVFIIGDFLLSIYGIINEGLYRI